MILNFAWTLSCIVHMLVFNSQSRQIILLWLSVCMIWGYFLHRKEGFTSFFIICIHCHIWSWNGLGSYGCLKNCVCLFIDIFTLITAAAVICRQSFMVLPVQKCFQSVKNSLHRRRSGLRRYKLVLVDSFFTTWLVVWSTVFAYVAVIMTSRFLAEVLLLCPHSMGAFWNMTIRPSVCLSHGTAV